jgi:hypothetical protein
VGEETWFVDLTASPKTSGSLGSCFGSVRFVGYTSIKTADAEIEGGNGSVARDPGTIAMNQGNMVGLIDIASD